MPKRSKILIVDDMEINRTLLAEVFYEEFEIIEAENGKVALDMISRYYESISAVFLDVVMPVMDGITVLKELNSTNLINKFPIILITSDDSPETQKKCYELSVSDIIYKPYVPLIIKTRVHNLIELYSYKNKLEDNIAMQKKKMEDLIETQARNFSELLKIQQDEIRARARLFREYNNIIVKILSTVIEFRNLESFSHIHKIQHFTNIILLT
ncbi:MAG: response regulator, partial [Firmicutes bacterium]|nr:response regulator [Bacillota bacterium]